MTIYIKKLLQRKYMSDFLNQQNNYWQNEANSKANDLIHKSNEAHNANMAQIEAEKKAKAATDEVAQYENEVDYFVDLGEKILIKLKATEEQLAKTQNELNFYKNLLSKPFAEIALHHEGFRSSYEAQRELIASWIVSQKAFKEVAIDLGKNFGKEAEEIIELAKEARINVLENKTVHNNDAKDIDFLLPYIDSILDKVKQDK